MTTSALITDTSIEATFEQVLYIQSLIQFCQKNNKNKNKKMRALIDLSSKINAIYPVYTIKLCLYARKIDASMQKIKKSDLDIFKIVIADCFIKNKLERV